MADELERANIKQLLEIAAREDIDVEDVKTRADLIAAIRRWREY